VDDEGHGKPNNIVQKILSLLGGYSDFDVDKNIVLVASGCE
jgi:hypothetical protein